MFRRNSNDVPLSFCCVEEPRLPGKKNYAEMFCRYRKERECVNWFPPAMITLSKVDLRMYEGGVGGWGGKRDPVHEEVWCTSDESYSANRKKGKASDKKCGEMQEAYRDIQGLKKDVGTSKHICTA